MSKHTTTSLLAVAHLALRLHAATSSVTLVEEANLKIIHELNTAPKLNNASAVFAPNAFLGYNAEEHAKLRGLDAGELLQDSTLHPSTLEKTFAG